MKIGKHSAKEIIISLNKILNKPLFLVALAALAIISAAVIFFLSSQNELASPKNPEDIKANNEQIARDIIDEVGNLVVLPNEEPVVATIADVKTLQKQPFFDKAQNGDKVLIFENAKKAILYRSTTKQIIEMGPVEISASQSASTSPLPSTSQTRSVIKPVNSINLTPQ